MLRFLSRLIGLDGEVDRLRVEVRRLSDRLEALRVDPVFGVYNRPALLETAACLPRGERAVVFLDFDHVHRLNQLLGYESVNRRLRAALAFSRRASDLVGRWFSGDEVVIVADGDRAVAERLLVKLKAAAATQGLSFKHVVGSWRKDDETLDACVGRLVGTASWAGAPPAREDRSGEGRAEPQIVLA